MPVTIRYKLVNLGTVTWFYFPSFCSAQIVLYFTSEFETSVLEVKLVFLIFGTDIGGFTYYL